MFIVTNIMSKWDGSILSIFSNKIKNDGDNNQIIIDYDIKKFKSSLLTIK